MIKDRGSREHRRNKSELHSLPEPPRKVKKKDRAKISKVAAGPTCPQTMNSDLVHSLVAKSMRNVPRKQIIVEEIEDDCPQEQSPQEFFRFGKRTLKEAQASLPEMEEIVEVPDTGSYSQRNTENRPENKENTREFLNQQPGTRMKISLDQLDPPKGKEAQSHRGFRNCSHRSQSRSSRSHNGSQSTVELRGKSGKPRKKGARKGRSGKLQELDRQVRLIWDCIGEIWLKTKTTQKVLVNQSEMFEDTSLQLQNLSLKQRAQEKDLLELKLMQNRG